MWIAYKNMFIITSKPQTIKTKTYDTTTSAFTSVSNHVSHEKNYVDLYYFAKLFNKTYDIFTVNHNDFMHSSFTGLKHWTYKFQGAKQESHWLSWLARR